jgi:predicted DNA binding CopG/RHH family protein
MSNDIKQHIDQDLRWDKGELGRDADHAKAASLTKDQQASIDVAAGLQMISIRLPTDLIDAFRFIGDTQGIRYQTLMRQVLVRFADCEMKQMARSAAAAQIEQAKQSESHLGEAV